MLELPNTIQNKFKETEKYLKYQHWRAEVEKDQIKCLKIKNLIKSELKESFKYLFKILMKGKLMTWETSEKIT